MTKEKAIDLLDNLIGTVEDNQESDYDTALKMGKQALSQEPCEKCEVGNPCLYCKREFEPQESEKDACKDCYYNDGEVHAECVICDKAESEDKT